MAREAADATRSDERVFALVPIKRFRGAKSRLAAVLDDEARARFARFLCEHVLSVLEHAHGIAGVFVVTDGQEVASLARARGARALSDEASGPLGRVIDAALPPLQRCGATAALVLMADLPELRAADVQALLARLPGHDLVVAPDEKGEGTNALLVRLPPPGPTSFGHRDSFSRHLAAGEALGLAVAVHRSPGLGFDVDEPAALARIDLSGVPRGAAVGTRFRP